MKNLTAAIVLRILFFITSALYVFTASYSPALGLYFTPPYWIVMFLLYLQMKKQYKSHPDSRPLTKDLILPEFASKDEREIELTGKAAKDALSAVFLSTPVFLVLAATSIIFEGTLSLLLPFLLIAAIPIAALVTYYFSYRHHYLQ